MQYLIFEIVSPRFIDICGIDFKMHTKDSNNSGRSGTAVFLFLKMIIIAHWAIIRMQL